VVCGTSRFNTDIRGFTEDVQCAMQDGTVGAGSSVMLGSASLGDATIGARLDVLGLTRRHAAALCACAVGFGFDLMEIGLGAVLSAVFSSPGRHMASTPLALLLSAPYCGAVIGAPVVGGWFGQRFGPKHGMIVALVLIGAGSLCFALTTPVAGLVALRAATGLAFGAFSPLMFTYLTEILPPAKRGRLCALVVAVASLGAPLGILCIRRLENTVLPLEPWRCVFLLGSLGAFVSAFALYYVPESPRWLSSKGRIASAERAVRQFEESQKVALPRPRPTAVAPMASISRMETPKLLTSQVLLLCVLFFLGPWATTGFPLLSGATFIAKGYNLHDALTFVNVATLGPAVATTLAATVFESVDRRAAITACALVMAAALALFAVGRTPMTLVVASLSFEIVTTLYLTVLNIYTAELVPTKRRAQWTSNAWALNRLGAGLAPLVLVPVLRAYGVSTMLAVLCGVSGIMVFISMISPRGMRRRSIQ
jgi:putative MFS transporter